jgi:hypothetical protein
LCEALIVIGGGMLFLGTLETRIKRRLALRMIHELETLAPPPEPLEAAEEFHRELSGRLR